MGQIPWCKAEHQENLRLIFEKYGITGGDAWEFSSCNLIIGENGAGKSRLLCAIRQACQEASVFSIYMDFTQISGVRPTVEAAPDYSTLSDPLLYHGALSAQLYTDFVPFLERDAAAFLQQLNEPFVSRGRSLTARRQEINKFLQEQLGRKLVFDQSGEVMISSRDGKRSPLTLANAIAEMSPGERSILYFALGILCVEVDSDIHQDFVLLLDEPENHLHPRAVMDLVRAVKGIRKGRGHGYVLVASHSVFLIPMFRFEELILMRNGKIDRPTAGIYANAYNVLIGNPNGDNGLQQMLSSLSRWSFGDYLSQCLCDPTVSDRARANDPEFQKLIQALEPLLQKGKAIRLLDYGGGSGRIAKCMQLRFRENPKDSLIGRLSYDVYDPYLDEAELPDEAWMKRRFNGKGGHKPALQSYDLVVLFNVLHEVDVTEWADTLNDIFNLLDKDGLLVFGERMVLSQGERPYGKSGYLVLRQEELCKLFGRPRVKELLLGEDKRDPTVCCVIQPIIGRKVTNADVQEALKALQDRSWKMVQQAIDQRVGARQAREYAFYCQQYINTKHALGLLDENPSLKNLTLNHT